MPRTPDFPIFNNAVAFTVSHNLEMCFSNNRPLIHYGDILPFVLPLPVFLFSITSIFLTAVLPVLYLLYLFQRPMSPQTHVLSGYFSLHIAYCSLLTILLLLFSSCSSPSTYVFFPLLLGAKLPLSNPCSRLIYYYYSSLSSWVTYWPSSLFKGPWTSTIPPSDPFLPLLNPFIHCLMPCPVLDDISVYQITGCTSTQCLI